ncbi:MAG: polyhydroxyalkanoate synthesis regulator DNA-binding domain-containing protein [Terriglobia bacterium]
MNNQTVLIKKYGDRRLYDTSASRYVTLEDIATMVRKGIDVEVRDRRSGKDVTSIILTQIIGEDARDRESTLPLQLLQQIVRASDRASHEFISWYLTTTLELYQKAQETVRTRISDAKTAVSAPFDFVRGLLAGQTWPPTSAATPASPASPANDLVEVEKLRRRVQELEARLAELDKPTKPARRAAKRKRST